MRPGHWTREDLDKLARLYADTHTRDLAAQFGRTESSISNKAVVLGLKKSDEYHQRKPGVFRPGHTTWNQGKKGTTGHHPNCQATWFKPGQLSGKAARLYKRVGSLRINDGQLQRKVTDDPQLKGCRKWIAVTRLVWEAANGPVPAGHAVTFKAGRATIVEQEITLEAIELVSRGELMRRNSRHTRYPEELNKLMQLKGALNRKINNRLREETTA